MKGLPPALVAACKHGHGPVAAVEHAIGTEAGDGVFQVRTQVVDGPAVVIGFGDQAGEFAAMNVWAFCKGGEMVLPGLFEFRGDVRLANVVEDEGGVWAGIDQGEYVRELGMRDTEIEA